MPGQGYEVTAGGNDPGDFVGGGARYPMVMAFAERFGTDHSEMDWKRDYCDVNPHYDH